MFTGIIETTGRIRAIERTSLGATLVISAPGVAPELKVGESVAVNGVCLTVTVPGPEVFTADLSPETLERTTLGRARSGLTVNLERPLTPASRLGGHFVQGHVDGVGNFVSAIPSGAGIVIGVEFPRILERYLVYKGSVAVDGISLTIASIQGARFTVAVIPHTLRATNLQSLKPGDAVNIETDMLGKYIERFVQLGLVKTPALTADYLKEQGY